jgi:hypothetical protein
VNHVKAEVLPVCLGGSRRKISFYVRESNQCSSDAAMPYTARVDAEVMSLADVLDNRTAERILIKMDIQGMELETLGSFVPNETRPVWIIGELHGHNANAGVLEAIFKENGWGLAFHDDIGTDSIFEAWSPAAEPLLHDPAVA